MGYHQPCHLRALNIGTPGLDLIRRIPEIDVEFIDRGCSGMAGTFGLKAGNYAVSLEAGRPMLEELKRPRVLFGSTECSTCRMQMEEGSGKRTLHPAQYLAFAYGPAPSFPIDPHMKIRLFARARELAGTDTLEMELPAGATVGELRRRIAAASPALTGLLERSALAVNDEFADDSQILPAEAEVAVLPPVSGGLL